MTTPTQLPAWKALEAHYEKVAPLQMRDLFKEDPKRFEKFSLRFEDILFDFSKNRITEETLSLLRDLAKQSDLKGWTAPDTSADVSEGTKANAPEPV